MFLATLAAELANEEKPAEVRRLAGIIVKNSIKAKVCAGAFSLWAARPGQGLRMLRWLLASPGGRAGCD